MNRNDQAEGVSQTVTTGAKGGREAEKMSRLEVRDQPEAGDLTMQLEMREAQLAALTAQLEASELRARNLSRCLAARQSEITELQAISEAQGVRERNLVAKVLKQEAAVREVLASTSWQITRPMRRLGDVAPGLARLGGRLLKLLSWVVRGQFWRIWHSLRSACPPRRSSSNKRASLSDLASDEDLPDARIASEPTLAAVLPVLDIAPIRIGSRPTHAADIHFWQYPCLTERDASDRHLKLVYGSNLDLQRRVIHTYLALPWATYIDRRSDLSTIKGIVQARVNSSRACARSLGFELAVHTVCQHYAWWHIGSVFAELGVTDLHLSHCTPKAVVHFGGMNIRVHSWSLYAVNVEDPGRRAGLEVLKATKRYVASFVGSHMNHYLSDVRLRLAEAARKDGGSDILVELTDRWHFNPVVYEEQVKRRTLNRRELNQHALATERYNKILSDSVFSLCPEGAGPNSLRLWESLAVGSIPVAIFDDWIPPSAGHGSPRFDDACLVVRPTEIDGLFDRLRGTDISEIEARRQACVALYDAINTKLTYYPRKTSQGSITVDSLTH